MTQIQQVYGAPQTDAEIIMLAGAICGQFNLTLNDSGDKLALAASQIYGALQSSEMGSNRWRFCQHTQQVSIFEAIPPLEQFDSWSYKAKLPGDLLILNATYPFVLYAVWGDELLLTGTSPLQLKYLRYVPVSMWGPAFKFFMAYQLAENIAGPTVSPTRYKQIQDLRKHWESRALFADAQSTPQRAFIHTPWWDIRFEGGT